MKERQYGPCGLYCGACGATDCGGCRSDRVDDYVSQCKFRRCAREKEQDFCCSCDEYPCRELDEFMKDKWPHHWTIRPSLQYIRDNGLEKWLTVQKEVWSCKDCGARVYWYQKTCDCGRRLEAWDLPQ